MQIIRMTCYLILVLLSTSSWAVAEESSLWDKTKASASSATTWTKEKSEEAWEASQDEREDALAWTADKAKKGWQGASDFVDQVAN